MKLTQEELNSMIAEAVTNVLNESAENESVFGHFVKGVGKDAWSGIKSGAQNLANKAKGAYDTAKNYVNTQVTDAISKQKKDEEAQLAKLQQELETMTQQDAAQVAQYRGQLMADVNRKVAAFSNQLKAKRNKFGDKVAKQQGVVGDYANRLSQRVGDSVSGQEYRQLAESIDRIVRDVVKRNLI